MRVGSVITVLVCVLLTSSHLEVRAHTDSDEHDLSLEQEEEAYYNRKDTQPDHVVKINTKDETVTIPLQYYSYLVSNCGGMVYMDCTVKPTFDGYRLDEKTGVLYANFGYENLCPRNIEIPVGEFNHFHPMPAFRGQPTTFLMGKHSFILELSMETGKTLSWDIRGPNRKLGHACSAGKFSF